MVVRVWQCFCSRSLTTFHTLSVFIAVRTETCHSFLSSFRLKIFAAFSLFLLENLATIPSTVVVSTAMFVFKYICLQISWQVFWMMFSWQIFMSSNFCFVLDLECLQRFRSTVTWSQALPMGASLIDVTI